MAGPRSITQNAPDARHWSLVPAHERRNTSARRVRALIFTLAPLFATWALAWWMLSHDPAPAIALILVNAAFLVHLFITKHNRGYGSRFRCRHQRNCPGHAIRVATLTPDDIRPMTHAIGQASTDSNGADHGHRLISRGPFYRLARVLRDHHALARLSRLTHRESLCQALCNQPGRRLVTFAKAKQLPL